MMKYVVLTLTMMITHNVLAGDVALNLKSGCQTRKIDTAYAATTEIYGYDCTEAKELYIKMKGDANVKVEHRESDFTTEDLIVENSHSIILSVGDNQCVYDHIQRYDAIDDGFPIDSYTYYSCKTVVKKSGFTNSMLSKIRYIK